MNVIRRAITIALGFVRERANESSTRLLMLTLGLTACQVSLFTIGFVFVRNSQVHALELLQMQAAAMGKQIVMTQPDQGVSMVMALTGLVTALVVNGSVVIALKTRKDAEPGDSPSVVSPVIPSNPPPPAGPQI